MNALTKHDIINDIVANTALDRAEASQGVEIVLDIMKKTLSQGEPVSISGFGKWDVKKKRARRGRNPKTGDEMEITPRRVVTFSLSNVFRAKLEGKR